MKTLVVCSGGLDSVVLAYKVAAEGTLAGLITFDYGQRHRREIDFAQKCAEQLACPHSLIDISSVGRFLSGSALTDKSVDVPDGYYYAETMKDTVVPNRNAIMLSIAYGVAAGLNASRVAAAMHGGDHFIYPDCRPDFMKAFSDMERLALDGVATIDLYTPFINQPKNAIVTEGARLHVPFEESWSCYKGGEIHCGSCGTCVARQEAFHKAGVNDPTPYANSDYWKTVCPT